MGVDEGWLFGVAALTVLGCIVGLGLSIVPLLVNLWWHRHTPVSRGVSAAVVAAYVAIGFWVHHALGVSYASELANANPAGGCDFGGDMGGCDPMSDGRQGWILVWVVAGLVVYAVRRRASRWCVCCGEPLIPARNGGYFRGQ